MSGETILQEADRLVSTDRQGSYGHPIDDFKATGKMWGALLGRVGYVGGTDVSPEMVGLMMVALKLSREAHKPKRDNRVDMAGYAKTVDLIQEHNSHTL